MGVGDLEENLPPLCLGFNAFFLVEKVVELPITIMVDNKSPTNAGL